MISDADFTLIFSLETKAGCQRVLVGFLSRAKGLINYASRTAILPEGSARGELKRRKATAQ